MDNTPNRYDNDFSRHVKRMNEIAAQDERMMQAGKISEERRQWLVKNPHRDHEGFAGLLAIVVAGAVGWWDHSSDLALEWWGHVLLIGGTLFAAYWFFLKNRWLTKTLWFVTVGAIVIASIGFIMNN